MVHQNPELRHSRLLLGVYNFSTSWRNNNTEIWHQKCFWILTALHCSLQLVHSVGQYIPLLCSYWIKVLTGFRISMLSLMCSAKGAYHFCFQGLTWPAMYALVGHWIPINERSRFMSSFQGLSIGIGLTYPIGGYLIAYFGWRSLFYFSGITGIIWCIMWYFLAFDSPETHPRISIRLVDRILNTYRTSILLLLGNCNISKVIPTTLLKR